MHNINRCEKNDITTYYEKSITRSLFFFFTPFN